MAVFARCQYYEHDFYFVGQPYQREPISITFAYIHGPAYSQSIVL